MSRAKFKWKKKSQGLLGSFSISDQKVIVSWVLVVLHGQTLYSLVAGTWSETKKMYHGGFFLKLADDNV